MLKNVSFKCKENDRREDRVFCCCAPCRREIGFFRVPFFGCFSFSCFRARILFKSRLHGIHLATLCVLLSWPPDKRTLVLGPCFFHRNFSSSCHVAPRLISALTELMGLLKALLRHQPRVLASPFPDL